MILSTIQASKNNFWFYYPFWDQAVAKKKPNRGLWLMNGLANFGYWSVRFGQLVVISHAVATLVGEVHSGGTKHPKNYYI